MSFLWGKLLYSFVDSCSAAAWERNKHNREVTLKLNCISWRKLKILCILCFYEVPQWRLTGEIYHLLAKVTKNNTPTAMLFIYEEQSTLGKIHTRDTYFGRNCGNCQKHRDDQSRTAESPEEKQAHRGHYLLTHLHFSIQGNTWCTNSPFTTPAGQLPWLLSQELLNFSELPFTLPFAPKPFCFLHEYNGLLQQLRCLASWTQDDAHPDAGPWCARTADYAAVGWNSGYFYCTI